MFTLLLGLTAIVTGVYQLIGSHTLIELEKKEGNLKSSTVPYVMWSSVLISMIIIVLGVCILAYIGVKAY
ncbi:hypothetical protein [Companilactobacillus jidongensis]|uniref:hypothetical protein n=1 Tax=Companilactobacillus jidongensis TaxID=2486006 RepID=UPI000F775786|nr:hypothetical protein [Companilactobacillus jidongensis]